MFQVVALGYCQLSVPRSPTTSEAEALRGDRVRNIGRRAVVTAGLFCYSPRVFETLRRARESERLAE